MSTIQSLGIGSGLNIEEIVTAIVDAERVPKEEAITAKVDTANAKISAYGDLKSRLSTLQSSISSLKQSSNFSQKEVTTDGSAFTATASTIAESTSYSVSVNSLAKSQSLATNAFSSVDEVIGTGTLNIKFGTTTYSELGVYGFSESGKKQELNLTIDSNNNSISKLKDYINKNDYGFSASIVNDGSGYRLVLTAESGVENSLQISVTDGDGTDTDGSGLSQLAMNLDTQKMTQNVAAANASLSINGISITSTSNTVTNAVNGVTLNLTDTTTNAKTLTITPKTEQFKEQVQGMVDAYNEFMTYASDITSYSSTSGGSLLLGDSTTRSIINQLRNTMFSQVKGVSTGLQALSNIGILSTQSDGTLEFDETKFDEAITEKGDQFQQLFSTSGSTTDSNIQFVSGSSLTKEGSYDIKISQLATKGSFTGSAVLPDFSNSGSVTINDDNDNFAIRVNGTSSGQLSIKQKTYTTGESLASAIQEAINGSTTLKNAGASVTVTYDPDSNNLKFISNTYGSTSGVAFTGVDTNSAAELGFSVGTGVSGTDVQGTINGVEGTGSGQYLSVNSGNASGIKIAVTGGNVSTDGAERGSVTFSRGIANQLDELIKSFLDADTGYLTTRLDGLDDSLTEYEAQQEALDYSMGKLESRLLDQFNSIDVVVNQLNSLGSYLEQALASLPGAKSSKS